MTGNEMLSTLGLRLEDPSESSFTQAAKLDALNIAQKSVVNLIHNAYLGELQVIDEGKAMTDNTIDLSANGDLSEEVMRNGIIAVYDSTDDVWCTMIDPGDQKRLENSYLAGSAANPVAYVFSNKLFVDGPGATDTVDVWYLRSPADIEADGNECSLNVALHESVVDMAESQLWKMDAKNDRATAAYANGKGQIDSLNARYPTEAPTGIGTKGRG
ncbi:MAG: hypothetical protein CMB80_00255 [Flammeovirgaceae bacterium]|nr:hypothetical protein [Flammeovirgaceae bacterium]